MSGTTAPAPASVFGHVHFDSEVRSEVMACLVDPSASTSRTHLTSEQQRVVFAPPDVTGVVVAGAGSGKTLVMAARMVALAASGLPAESLLGLTFTRKAAAELAERVDVTLTRARKRGLVAGDHNDPEVSTYHSFAQQLVRDSGLFAGIDPGLRIETDFALLPLAVSVTARSTHLRGEHGMDLTKAVANMRRLDSECAEHAVQPADVRAIESQRLAQMFGRAKQTANIKELMATANERILLTHVVEEYRDAKRNAGVMDFADMMRLAFDAAAHPQVRAHTREQFTSVLLDEYQDTSVVQRKLLQRLFDDNHPVLAVGDPKQSIYGFRGAAVANIEDFTTHFPHNGSQAPVFTLSANFRSAEPIVDVANRSRAVQVATERNGSDAGLTTGRTELTGRVRIANFRTNNDEVRAVIAGVGEELARGVPAKDVLVLVRSNAEADEYTAALQRAGIPAVSSDSLAVFDLPEIRDLLAVLAGSAQPAANTDVVRLLAGPRWRLGAGDLAVLGRRAAQRGTTDPVDLDGVIAQVAQESDPSAEPSLIDALFTLLDSESGLDERFSTEARERLTAFAEELDGFSAHTGEPLTDQFARILRTTGADTEILLGERATQRMAAVNALFTAAAAYEAAYPDGGVVGFLRAVELARKHELDPQFDPPVFHDSVRVLTVHKAKGLEAESVFLPGWDANAFDKVSVSGHWTASSGRVPDDLRGDRDVNAMTTSELELFDNRLLVPLTNGAVKHIKGMEQNHLEQENDRLVYVALTRACQRLMVSAHVWSPGRARPDKPSQHVSALRGLDYVEEVDWYEPDEGETNPIGEDVEESPYPLRGDEATAHRRRGAERVLGRLAGHIVEPEEQMALQSLPQADRERVARWDRDIEALRREREHALQPDTGVRLPGTLSVTGFQSLMSDPSAYARSRRRPMPRRPSRAADIGTRFHDWVATRWGDQPALVADIDFAADAVLDLPDPALQKLIEAFEDSQFADRQPYGVEMPFTVTVAGQPVSGRIDAVFDNGPVGKGSSAPTQADHFESPASRMSERRWLIVDWKTGAHSKADELQLAVYRLAWSALHNVALDQIEVAFFYVARNELVYHRDLLDEAELGTALARLVGTPDNGGT